MQQPEVDNPKIAVLGNSEGTVLAPRVAIDNPNKVNNIIPMGTLAQNVTENTPLPNDILTSSIRYTLKKYWVKTVMAHYHCRKHPRRGL